VEVLNGHDGVFVHGVTVIEVTDHQRVDSAKFRKERYQQAQPVHGSQSSSSVGRRSMRRNRLHKACGSERAQSTVSESRLSTHSSASRLSSRLWRATISKRLRTSAGSSRIASGWRGKIRPRTTEKSALESRDLQS